MASPNQVGGVPGKGSSGQGFRSLDSVLTLSGLLGLKEGSLFTHLDLSFLISKMKEKIGLFLL